MMNKIPSPPVKKILYLPIEFWSQLLSILDRKTQALCESGGYGKIDLRLVIQEGRVINIYFTDEVVAKELTNILKKHHTT
jgi:hypothetical protein